MRRGEKKLFTLHPAQSIVASDTHRFRVINAGRRWGKALSIDTPILTATGFKTMGELSVGDFVFSEDGIPTRIISKSKVFKDHECYKITFSDGAEIVADANHEWIVENKKIRKNNARRKDNYYKMLKLTTEELSKDLFYKRSDGKLETNYSIPLALPPIHFGKDLPIETYFLGLWLGDGTSASTEITTIDDETIKYLYEFANSIGHKITRKNGKKYSYSIVKDRGGKDTLQSQLRKLGVLNNKHIPDLYKYSTIQMRFELLRGLMDTDGYISKDGYCEYVSSNKKLAYDVVELIWSLGIKATINEYDSKLYGRIVNKKYRIHFTTDKDIFNLTRKKERQKINIKSDTKRRFIVNVEKINSVPVQCIQVENPSHIYLAGKELIPTHNSTMVAWEMFAIAIANENARIPYYAPTRDDARDIMWKPLKEICGPLIVGEPNESRLEINVRNRFGGVSLIVLYGWEAVQERGKGVGVKNNHIFLDEVSKFKNFEFGWEEILRPTLIDLKGGATFISTPNGFNHFYDLSLKEGKDSDWKYFHFTSMDNPYLPPEEIEKMKIDLPADRYAQEVLGEFRKKEGLVYKDFTRANHVVEDLPDNFETLYTLGGVDWGYNHPCAVITIKKDYDGIYWITDEWYKTGRTESEIVDKVVSLCYNKVFPDPENASGIESLRRAGVNVREVNKGRGSVVSGISKVQEIIRQGRLKVLSRCSNVIREFESYSYPDNKDGTIDENPLKENDDAMDAIRYVLMTDTDSGGNSGPKVHYGTNKSFINRINHWGKFRK